MSMEQVEYLDIVDEEGNNTGEIIEKEKAHEKGILHKVAHIWILNQNNEILFQKRSSKKSRFPNLLDISAAGHISAGEKNNLAAIREIEEEIGLKVKETELGNSIKYSSRIDMDSFIENEVQYIYFIKLNFEKEKLLFSDGEVESCILLSFQNFQKKLRNSSELFVPHQKDYFDLVIENLKKLSDK